MSQSPPAWLLFPYLPFPLFQTKPKVSSPISSSFLSINPYLLNSKYSNSNERNNQMKGFCVHGVLLLSKCQPPFSHCVPSNRRVLCQVSNVKPHFKSVRPPAHHVVLSVGLFIIHLLTQIHSLTHSLYFASLFHLEDPQQTNIHFCFCLSWLRSLDGKVQYGEL